MAHKANKVVRCEEKKYIRAIVRRVHPDLFSDHPFERQKNSESLKALNSYVDELSQGCVRSSVQLEFWVKEAERLTEIRAELPRQGSFGPLFFAFGLITSQHLQGGVGDYGSGHENVNFLSWLRTTVHEAVRTAEQHEARKLLIRELRASIEDKFGLAAVQVGGEFAVSVLEQRRQIEALKVLDTCLHAMCVETPDLFAGLSVRLYHPDSCPLDTLCHLDCDGAYTLRSGPMQSHVADDGVLHLVAERESIRRGASGLDLARARTLTRLSSFWTRRVRDLSPALAELVGAETVWCDGRSEQAAQRFVLWAGCMLEHREDFRAALAGRRFAFSMLVHRDASSPMVDYAASSSVLQVRSDCPPGRLLDFLTSEAGLSADQAAQEVAESQAMEDLLLERVCTALNAKHVIRVCAAHDQRNVIAAAHRLLAQADAIRHAVDLTGACIAIDDCYELWESGFISIPYDFDVADLQPQLQKLLGEGRAAPAAASTQAPHASTPDAESPGFQASESDDVGWHDGWPGRGARHAEVQPWERLRDFRSAEQPCNAQAEFEPREAGLEGPGPADGLPEQCALYHGDDSMDHLAFAPGKYGGLPYSNTGCAGRREPSWWNGRTGSSAAAAGCRGAWLCEKRRKRERNLLRYSAHVAAPTTSRGLLVPRHRRLSVSPASRLTLLTSSVGTL